MTRRISPFPGTAYLFFPYTLDASQPRNGNPEADSWRPERKRREAGWSAARRSRYPFDRTIS